VVDPWGKQHDRNLFRGIFHWKLQRESPPVFRLPITKSHFTVKGFIWLECHCETTKKLNITDEGLAALLRIQGVREKVIVKFTLEQSTKAQRGSGSTLSLTSALDWLGGQRHAPAALPPGKTQYPLYRRLSGPQERSGRARKISPLP